MGEAGPLQKQCFRDSSISSRGSTRRRSSNSVSCCLVSLNSTSIVDITWHAAYSFITALMWKHATPSMSPEYHNCHLCICTQVPARPDKHMLRGCKYKAGGTQQQLRQLAEKLISQALGSAAFEPDADLKQWGYLNDQVCYQATK